MIPILRLCLIALAANAAMPATSLALATLQQDDPYSIVRAQPAAENEVEEVSLYVPAGGFLSRDAYLAARGDRDARVLRTRWRVERLALDGTPVSSQTSEIVIGDGYVTDITDPEAPVFDFAMNRILSRTATLTGPVMRNMPVIGHVHRQMDTFSFYTHAGELAEVTGPDGSHFERFWIEAAMGVRLVEVPMLINTTEEGVTEVRRNADGSALLKVTPGTAGTPADIDLFRRWLRHTAPIHPDALNVMIGLEGIPERFSYIVFSPSSPDGRQEVWTRLSAGESNTAFPWPENLPAASAADYEWSAPQYADLVQAGFDAVNAPEASPEAAEFLSAVDALEAGGDRAAALLVLSQAAHHQGACTARSTAPLCTRTSHLVAAGLGDTPFETLMLALASLQTDRSAGLDGLRPFLDRADLAGAAANLIAAEAVAALQSVDAEAEPDLDPLNLFARSADGDPYAALTYWHAGRYAASRGDVETAWVLFDIASSLPSTETTLPVREAAIMNEQLRGIAPNYFGPTGTTAAQGPADDGDENAVEGTE
tara:strand:+ start:1412 stop:3031 length:1620 start_codon:yes stop_codon:yes gene_type:complete